MGLNQWCQLDEQIYIAEIDERYKQHAGASYSERMTAQLAEMRTISAKTFVEFFPHTLALLMLQLTGVRGVSLTV
jgi:hypothetical protein